jgi:RNA polymerase subunit RPABC4/transcription elongation factor Spt4
MMKKVLACPQCLSPVAADDVFCGVCGYKMK